MIPPLHKVNTALYNKLPVGNTTVVFVHDNSASSGIWQNQFSSEILQDHPMVAFDLPGHGESPRRKTYSLSRTVETLVKNCGAFHRTVLVGHSLGGHLAIEALPYLQNCLGLMIFGTPPVRDPLNLQEAFLPDERMGLLFQKDLNPSETERFAEGVCKDFRSQQYDVTTTIRNTDPQFREDIGVSVTKGELADEAGILERAKIPIAVVHGTDDPFANAKYLNGLHIPTLWRDRVHVMEDTGHSPHLEKPEQFNRLLCEFLNDLA